MTRGAHGILAVGSFVPRSRLPCRLAQAANGWFAPSLNPGSDARRSFCDWDEDALTMAVEAGRACGLAPHATAVAAVELASTSLPFADRSNAGVVREALDLPAAAVEDKGGSLRAASTALVRALTRHGNGTLLIGSDCVDAKPASAQEMRFGHGAGAVLVGTGEPIASVAGTVSVHQDFVDHYRSTGERFEYALEPRWARDAGYRQQVLASVEQALNASGRQARDVSALAISAPGGLADRVGTVRSFTEDWLAYTPKPPLVFGNVGFGNGANVLMEFADVEPGQLKVGMPLAMRFRIKDVDERRRFRRYFWKPVPLGGHADA